MPLKSYQLTLKWAENITNNVRHFAFTSDDPGILAFEPGQFLTIHFQKDGKAIKRSYSIATVPGQSEYVEFSAGAVEGGPGTELLFNLKPGDSIQVMGPFGRLILRDEHPKRYIFVATSTGVTPYRSMMPLLAERMQNEGTEMVLLEGVQYREDLLFGDEFLAFAKANPKFTFRAHFSRDALTNPQPHEFSGYVQTAFADLNPNPETDVVYLCGNPGMIDAAFADLTARGFDVKNVRREKYISN